MNRMLIAFLSLPLLGAAGPGKPDDGPPPAPADAPGYAFVRGDTLYSLARWAGTNVPALLAANPGVDPTRIEIGDVVRLPAGARDPAPLRFREYGDGPGPAAARIAVRTAMPPPPPPRLRPEPPPRPRVPAPVIQRIRPAPPSEPAPANEDEDKPRNGPEGM
jgi:LysM repeat protein